MISIIPTSSLHRLVLFISIAVFLISAGWGLGEPWLIGNNGDEAYAGAQYHAISRHMLTHGPIRLHLAQLRMYHDIPENDLFAEGKFDGVWLRKRYGDQFWVSRLPFGALLHVASMAIIGDTEAAIRFVPYCATLLLIIIIYLLLRGRFGESPAVWSASIFALTPSTILNARLAGYELPCLLLVVAALLLYDRYREGLCGFSIVWFTCLAAGLMGWFGLYLVPIMIIESLRLCRSVDMHWRERLLLLLIPIVVVGLYALYLHSLGQPLGERLDYFWNARSVGAVQAIESEDGFSFWHFLHRTQKYFTNHVTVLPLLLAFGWVVQMLRHRSPELSLLLTFAVFGLLCYTVSMRAAYEHRYYVLWWSPFIACAGGFFVSRLCSSGQKGLE